MAKSDDKNEKKASEAEGAAKKEEKQPAGAEGEVNIEQPENALSEAEALKAELDATAQYMLRLRADFENFKKRNADIAAKMFDEGLTNAVLALLPAADSVDRAIAYYKDDKDKEGVMLIGKQIEKALDTLGIKEVEALGQKFDPNLHEAVAHVEDKEHEGQVVEVYQRGYRYKDRVLRHSLVKVAG